MRLKVFMACALGGGIGALVALQLAPALWWIGILVGGLIGYLSYEFKAVLRAVPKAWKRAQRDLPQAAWAIVKAVPVILVVITNLTLLCLGVVLFVIAIAFFAFKQPSPSLASIMVVLMFLVAMPVSVGATFYLVAKLKPYCDEKRGKLVLCPLTSLWLLQYYFVYLPRLLARGALWLIRHTPKAPKYLCLGVVLGLYWSVILLARFFKHLFLLIHSDLRLLCASYAMIGAIIGFTFGNALIGAAAGGALGLLGFELIFRLYHNTAPSSTR